MTEYEIRYSSRKTLSLRVERDGRLVVLAPNGTSAKTIADAVERHRQWIENAKLRQEDRAARHPEPTAGELQEMIEKARKLIPEKVKFWSKIMGVTPVRITITTAKTRFGSCSGKNAVSFSARLMAYPEKAIDYVVVHELSHIRHHDHSKAFWAEVAKYLPDYKEREKLLK